MSGQKTLAEQTLGRIGKTLISSRRLASLLAAWVSCAAAFGQLVDSLDAYPPRWQLAGSDCHARVVRHVNEPTSGVRGSGCESVTLSCGHGTKAMLEYRIEPTRVIDDLTASVDIKSPKPGVSVGLRVRFPYLHDPTTGRSTVVVIPGAVYRDAGRWKRIGIGAISRPLQLKMIALRRAHGSDINLDDHFVDAVVINAYTGPGEATVLIDNLTVDAMVPLVSSGQLVEAARSAEPPAGDTAQQPQRFDTDKLLGRLASSSRSTATTAGQAADAKPSSLATSGRLTRILQHHDEPLSWVKDLGFDTVLVARSPDAALLNEATRSGVRVIAPPPTAPDPVLQPLLEPLVGYYLGTSLSSLRLQAATETSRRIGSWPLAWQRPLLAAPVEDRRAYAAISDFLITDLASPLRGLSAGEDGEILRRAGSHRGSAAGQHGIGVSTDAPEALRQQLDWIAAASGAPRGTADWSWQATLLQVARALTTAPGAILFRSDRSLTSGTPADQRRSIGLSYINRYLDAIGGLVIAGNPAPALPTRGADYQAGRIDFPGGELLIATSNTQYRGRVLAGDGDTLQIDLPPAHSHQFAWRITHFAAERMSFDSGSRGTWLEITSPDVVETILLSNDPSMGGRLATLLQPLASQAATDRWQLTRETHLQASDDWQTAAATGSVATSGSADRLLQAASEALVQAELAFRAGNAVSTLRRCRRASAWTARAQWQLNQSLSPSGQLDPLSSIPPLLADGGVPARLLWAPLGSEDRWSDNLLLGGSLDSQSLLGEAGWKVGRRPNPPLPVRAEAQIVRGPQVEGDGCLLASVVAQGDGPLPGGYAGTTMQIRSPTVPLEDQTAVRIDARIKTLGFGGPDQGVLVYDNVVGPELGVLVRGKPSWQNVRLYRIVPAGRQVCVLFELIGAGEASIDDVQLRAWQATDRR